MWTAISRVKATATRGPCEERVMASATSKRADMNLATLKEIVDASGSAV